jgi:hypothetical protein
MSDLTPIEGHVRLSVASSTRMRSLITTAPPRCRPGRVTRTATVSHGNRQLNAAIHRIAITQLSHHPQARVFRDRRIARGDTPAEALRALKRRLCHVAFGALLADAELTRSTGLESAA